MKFPSKFLTNADFRHINSHIQSDPFKHRATKTSAKMRFSLTTIVIALLGTAMALPNPDLKTLEERAAVSALFGILSSSSDCFDG